MANPSKRKGSGFELEVVRALQDAGLAAEKMPLSGAVKGFEGDVSCPVQGSDWKLECKRRARAFSTLYGYLTGHSHAVVIRDDRCPPLVVMTLDRFAKLARGNT